MKRTMYVLAFLYFFTLPVFAQKAKQDSTKMLCRLWIIDRKAMEEQFKGKEEYKRMLNDMERFDIYMRIEKDGKLFTNQTGPEEKEYGWEFSPDKKSVSMMGGRAQMVIKELSNKKFTFVVPDPNRSGLVFYMIAPKKGYELRKQYAKKLGPDKIRKNKKY